jgi:AcrR family transcriptional regulator
MRNRDPDRLDRLVNAASHVFIDVEFERAKISDVARQAGMAAGTVYLYFKDKEGLFEVAFLRACESPLVAELKLPYRRTTGPATRAQLENAVEAIANFPQLWVAGQRRNVVDGVTEYSGILLELAAWISRYRPAILIAHRNRRRRPELQHAFDRLVWRDLEQRLAAHIETRTRTGLLGAVGEPAAVAALALDALAGALLGNPVHAVPNDPRRAAELAARLLVPAPTASGNLPLPADPME